MLMFRVSVCCECDAMMPFVERAWFSQEQMGI